MKVLMAHMGMDIGGAETHVLELCTALARKGADVFVISNGGVYENQLIESGVKHIKAPLNNKRPLSLIRSYAAMRRAVLDNGIEVVHAHARIPAFLCGILRRALALRGYKLRFVTTAHLNFNTALPYKILSNWGQAALAVSADIKGYLTHNYRVTPEKIIITVNGVDTERFSPKTREQSDGLRAELGINAAWVALSVSRLDADRSLAALELIKAVGRLSKQYDIQAVIVGSGNDERRVKELAESVNAGAGRGVIILAGGRTDISRFMGTADIFVNVSRSALEAMACGLPVILAGNQGYLGIFDETKLEAAVSTNFCCRDTEETTAEKLINDVKFLLESSPARRNALGEFGRSVAVKAYSVEKMADDALSAYKRAENKPDAVISGYYGFRNHGDDTLLTTIVNDLRALKPDVDVCVLSKRPWETREALGVRAVNRFNLPAIKRLFRQKPLLISGGGTLIQDVTSTQSLLYYLYIINMAKRAGAPVMLYANGIGPVLKAANRRRAAAALNRVDLITLRDGESLAALDGLGAKPPMALVTADPAYGADAPDPRRSGNYFCVSVRNWKTLPPDFDARIAAFCEGVYKKHGLSAVFVIMQPANDEEMTARIIRRLKTPCSAAAANAREVIAGAAFILAMRLHAVVYAARAGVPMIGLVYDPKVESALSAFSLPYWQDAAKTEPGALAAFADDITRNRDELSRGIYEKSAGLARLAKENARMAVELLGRR
jgi:polysaccharide pyruvyl transferase CsaB